MTMHRIELAWGHVGHDGKTLGRDVLRYADERVLAVLSSLFGGGQLLHHFGGYLTKRGEY